ncbi:hypothetical protein FKM82_018120 [Ascaphus truei]
MVALEDWSWPPVHYIDALSLVLLTVTVLFLCPRYCPLCPSFPAPTLVNLEKVLPSRSLVVFSSSGTRLRQCPRMSDYGQRRCVNASTITFFSSEIEQMFKKPSASE